MNSKINRKIQPRYVTVKNQNLPQYIVEPGEKVKGLGLDGVVQIKDSGSVYCTGTLLPTGKHILTAGHCLYREDSSNIKVTFQLPTGDVTIPARELFLHPQYDDLTVANDIGIIELSKIAPVAAQRYDIYRQKDEIGQKHIKVGYGDTGKGKTKDIYDNLKRVGFNIYDDTANALNRKFFEQDNIPKNKQLAYDFDNGTRTHDAFGQIFGIWNTGLGADEVNSAPGDSGGPTFIDGKIAGITSYGFGKNSGVKTDVDSSTNSSFGEFSIDTRVSAYTNWIDQILNSSTSNSASSHDFNQDGNTDILWHNTANGNNQIWLMNGTQKQETVNFNSHSDTNWEIGGTADFNGDSNEDIIWRNYATGENQIWLMNGTSYQSTVNLKSRSDTNWEIGGTADFNGDSNEDILWRNYATGENQIWLMNGTSYQSTVNLKSRSDTNWEIGGTADFNGDSNEDILWRNYTTGANQVWLLNQTELNQVVNLQSWKNTDWEIVGCADFNDNQSDDILWRNSFTGRNQVWLMNGTQRVNTANLAAWTNTNWEAIL